MKKLNVALIAFVIGLIALIGTVLVKQGHITFPAKAPPEEVIALSKAMEVTRMETFDRRPFTRYWDHDTGLVCMVDDFGTVLGCGITTATFAQSAELNQQLQQKEYQDSANDVSQEALDATDPQVNHRPRSRHHFWYDKAHPEMIQN